MSENVAPAVHEMTPYDPGGAWMSTKTLQQKIYKFSWESEKQALNPKYKTTNSRAESYQLSANRSIRFYMALLHTPLDMHYDVKYVHI